MVYPTSKLPFEELTSIDERVDYVHNQVLAAQSGINQLLEKAGELPVGVITKEVRLRQLVIRNTGVRVWGRSPLTGRITQIIPHWPDGCNALVDVAFGHSDVWVMPASTDTFVALNDATPVIGVNEPVTKGEELWMVVNNHDGGNDHAISIVITVVGVP